MINILGIDEIVKNVYLLSKKYIGKTPPSTIEDLKPFYLEFLEKHQPYQPINRRNDLFIHDNNIEVKLKKAYQPSSLDDLNQQKMIAERHTEDERLYLHKIVQDGYNRLINSNHNIKHIFNLVIHSIFFMKTCDKFNISSFGGSSSTAMGSIWISGHGKISVDDVSEFLLHELIHHLLFVDERCHDQFNYKEIIKPENFSMSALLKKRRPMDKVVHSILVSSEIVIARKEFLKSKEIIIHPDTETLRKNTLLSISEVLNMKNINCLITERVKDFILKSYDLIS
ncbi:hypothetical protein PSI19_05425 [Xenorhabdus khoisanae]|uniref:hypothetical protein n=1 Tax=Xenorhabdus khoisanae TaxID=880157 RepID=UPI00235816A4|nr:hypothetical protein [Xenorhabdus khoisanae]MDC9613336.1 hypothetical protein [Xenorhabdus khoisanae]